MPEPSIHFDSVWKKFHRGEHHDTLRDALLALVRRRPRADNGMEADEFWAVKDVSFQVRPGETLGIIGGNGAGKSTVLKLLTRILRPNRGAIRVEGRIGALIEVSAGFHQDLTGRENIFLQGALMGMRRATIQQKFDEIVAFSGVEAFLDTPVKRYSSGMNARLGFSIAAHLDPDVLIVDEVLAVGDYRFQQRAYGRMADLARSGRPVVVVSHQLDRIAQLCSKAILLVSGKVHTAGKPTDCITAYLADDSALAAKETPAAVTRPALEPDAIVSVGTAFRVSATVSFRDRVEPSWGIAIRVRQLNDGQIVFATGSLRQGVTLPRQQQLRAQFDLHAHLIPGEYVVEIYVNDTMRGTDICVSAPAPFRVEGDNHAVGKAHLGGRITIGAPVADPDETSQAAVVTRHAGDQ